MSKLTAFQRFMLDYLNGECKLIAGLYLWPQDVRRDPRIAERCYWMV